MNIGYLLLVSIMLLSCNNGRKNGADVDKEVFDSFYVKFHSDSLFQKSRIKFPLPGLSNEVSAKKSEIYKVGINAKSYDFSINTYWAKNEWVIQHSLRDTAQFRRDLVSDDFAVLERIYIPDSGFEVKRVFRFLGDKWYLVYYSDVSL